MAERKKISIDEALKNNNGQTYKNADTITIKKGNNKRKSITIYTNEDEYNFLITKSEERLLSISNYVRTLIKKDMEKNN